MLVPKRLYRVHFGTKLATVTTFFIIFTHISHKLWHTKYAIQIGLKNADIKCCSYIHTTKRKKTHANVLYRVKLQDREIYSGG